MSLPNIIQQINSKLPLSGGTMTGIITRSGYLARSGDESNIIAIISGTDVTHGAGLWLAGNSYTTGSVPPGAFRLQCYNSETQVYTSLTGKPDGSLTWNGGEVLNSKGGQLTGPLYTTGNIPYESRHQTAANADTTRDEDLYQMLCVGLDKTSKRGGGIEVAYNTSGSRSIYFTMRNRTDDGWLNAGLVENADGTSYFNVNNNKVVTIAAQSTGSTGYRRYSDGFKIQWGRLNVNECVKTTVTLPIAFSNANYHVDVCNASGKTVGDTEGVMTVCDYTTTNFKISTGYINPNTSAAVWFACGY